MSMNIMSMNIDYKNMGNYIQIGMILFGLYDYVYKKYINQNKQNYNKLVYEYTLIASRNQLVNKIKMKENDIYLIKKKQEITDTEKQHIIKLIESNKNDLIDELLDVQYRIYFIDKNNNNNNKKQ
uniref:Uncharacterized protein n=1 Tax=Megaviridae environmental sample TaxID=1737588 RepID=A0A5J6VLB8_9VIRU|nr:MAG: hypothetical protein [Megaviridae environmental sample]